MSRARMIRVYAPLLNMFVSSLSFQLIAGGNDVQIGISECGKHCS